MKNYKGPIMKTGSTILESLILQCKVHYTVHTLLIPPEYSPILDKFGLAKLCSEALITGVRWSEQFSETTLAVVVAGSGDKGTVMFDFDFPADQLYFIYGAKQHGWCCGGMYRL